MGFAVVSWNIADLYFQQFKGRTTDKRRFIDAHVDTRCSCVCMQEAWNTNWWPEYDSDVRTFPRLASGLASLGGHEWSYAHFSHATGEDALARKGFGWCDMGDVVLYNTHLQADPVIKWSGNTARTVRQAQMKELRQHVEDMHANRTVLIVGDFNHRVVPLPGERFTGANNGFDGAISIRSPYTPTITEYPTELSDHPLIYVRLGPTHLKL